jgi:hypothetical protein
MNSKLSKHSPTFAAEVPCYADLQREIHDALLAENREWILPNGESPTCGFYEVPFAQLLMQLPRRAVRKLSHRTRRNLSLNSYMPNA